MRILSLPNWRIALRRRVDRAKKALVRAGRFISDVHYYWWQIGHRFRRALELARDTIYP